MNWRLGAAFLALSALSACAGLSGRAQCLQNAMCAARLAEPAVLAASDGRAQRQDDTLILKPTSAPAIVMTDRKQACEAALVDACQGFALMAYGAHAFVVQKFLYEGSVFDLIDDHSGRQTPLRGLPHFSPSGDEFLVAPFDLESDVGPDNLQIWRRAGDGATLEWSHPSRQAFVEDPSLPSLYEVRDVRWEKDRIVLTLSTAAQPDRSWRATLTRQSDGWHLAAKSPDGFFPPQSPPGPAKP